MKSIAELFWQWSLKKIISPAPIVATACFGLVVCNADEREKPQTVTYMVTFDSQGRQ